MFILYVCLIVFDVVSQEPNKQNKIKKKTFVTLPVFLSSGLPMRSAVSFPSRNLESYLYTKARDKLQ